MDFWVVCVLSGLVPCRNDDWCIALWDVHLNQGISVPDDEFYQTVRLAERQHHLFQHEDSQPIAMNWTDIEEAKMNSEYVFNVTVLVGGILIGVVALAAFMVTSRKLLEQ